MASTDSDDSPGFTCAPARISHPTHVPPPREGATGTGGAEEQSDLLEEVVGDSREYVVWAPQPPVHVNPRPRGSCARAVSFCLSSSRPAPAFTRGLLAHGKSIEDKNEGGGEKGERGRGMRPGHTLSRDMCCTRSRDMGGRGCLGSTCIHHKPVAHRNPLTTRQFREIQVSESQHRPQVRTPA